MGILGAPTRKMTLNGLPPPFRQCHAKNIQLLPQCVHYDTVPSPKTYFTLVSILSVCGLFLICPCVPNQAPPQRFCPVSGHVGAKALPGHFGPSTDHVCPLFRPFPPFPCLVAGRNNAKRPTRDIQTQTQCTGSGPHTVRGRIGRRATSCGLLSI